MGGAISNPPNDLMQAIRRGQTVETRNETQLRGILKQAEAAQKAGPVPFTEWLTSVRGQLTDYGVAVAQGGTAATKAGTGTGG